MADIMTAEQRSQRMRQIRSKDTRPEILVRRLLFHMGYRYRIHVKTLPGSPDIVFLGRRKAVFIHGCFWHMHSGCRDGKIPASRIEYWKPKLLRTKMRDADNLEKLTELGWRAMVLWECQLKNIEEIKEKLANFLAEN